MTALNRHAESSTRRATIGIRDDSGFTLIEMLVVMAIIAVLLGILLPTLASVRRSAEVTQCQSRLSSIGKAYEMFAADRRGRLPTHEYPLDTQGVADPVLVPEWGVGGGGWVILPINEISFWGYDLRGYIVDDPDGALLTAVESLSCPVVFREWIENLPPAQQDGAVMDPMTSPGDSFAHSVALFTSLGAWADPASPPDINAVHARVQTAHIVSPSAKANLVETASHHGRERAELTDGKSSERYNVLAMDGHVERLAGADALDAVGFVGDGTGLERPPIKRNAWAERGIPFISTRFGALGRDW